MNDIYTPPPYPINEFHIIIRDAAIELAYNTQAPDALIAMELLTNMSVSAQGLYDVKLPLGKISPVSLNCMIVAESGERMSGVHNIVAKPLYEFDSERMKRYKVELELYEQKMTAWKVANHGYSRKLAKAAQAGKSIEDASAKLLEWAKQMPSKPRARRIMRQNITDRAIMDALEGIGESVAFISDEGDVIINGGALNSMGTMNKAWDGAHMLTLDRSNGVSVVVQQPRVTVAFKAQPQVLKKLFDRRGDVMRGSGHWARYLVGCPASTQGRRYSHQQEKTWVHVETFHERMRELLSEFGRRVDAGNIDREVLDFSPEAKEEWLVLTNDLEAKLGPMGHFHDIKDFASKTMEITGRVAALLHIFSKQEGLISYDTLQRAMKMVQWHLYEFKRLFSPEVPVALEYEEAQTLLSYLHRLYQAGYAVIRKNDVLQSGPVRTSKRFEAALSLLISWNHVRITQGHKRQRFIELNPQFFSAHMQASPQ